MEKLIDEIFFLLASENKTLSTVESMTGGLLSATIVNKSGASKIFIGGLVTYQVQGKVRLLRKKEDFFAENGTISKKTARVMARQGIKILNSDYTIAVTGNAGPDALEDKPVGEVYIAISYKEDMRVAVTVKKFNFAGSRQKIREKAVASSLKLLVEVIKKERKENDQ